MMSGSLSHAAQGLATAVSGTLHGSTAESTRAHPTGSAQPYKPAPGIALYGDDCKPPVVLDGLQLNLEVCCPFRLLLLGLLLLCCSKASFCCHGVKALGVVYNL